MKFYTSILLFLFVLQPVVGYAQEQDPDTDTGQAKAGERESEEEEKKQSAENDDGKNEISPDIRESFLPSEEISEDLSVSFPVDI